MNHIYQTIWNATKCLWVCVSESARSYSRTHQRDDRHPVTQVMTKGCPFSAKRLIVAMLLGLGSVSSLHANVQYFNESNNVWQLNELSSMHSSWMYKDFLFPEIYSLNIWSRYTGDADGGSGSSTALDVSPSTPNMTGLTAVGGETDYAIRFSGSHFTVKNTMIEGNVLATNAGFALYRDNESRAQTSSLHGTVFLKGSVFHSKVPLGNVWTNGAQKEPSTPLSLHMQSLGGLNILELYPDTNDVLSFDVDALAQIAGNGRDPQAFQRLRVYNDLHLTNAFSVGNLKEIVVPSNPTKLLTAHLLSSGSDTSALTFQIGGLILINNGETVDLTAQYSSTEGSSTLFFARNAVILGHDYGDFLGASMLNPEYSIALEAPRELFVQGLPFWLQGKDRNTLFLALVEDISLIGDEVNTIGGITVRRGTTTLSGNVSKPVLVQDGATVIVEPGTKINLLNGQIGTVIVRGGEVDMSGWSGQLTVQLTDDPVTFTGPPTMVSGLITNALTMDTLSTQIQAMHPTSVELRALTDLDLTQLRYQPSRWSFATNTNVTGLPYAAQVNTNQTVSFLGGSVQVPHSLSNAGSVTYRGGIFTSGSRFDLLNPEASVTFMDAATVTVANLYNYQQGSSLFSVDHLNQIALSDDTQFQTLQREVGVRPTSTNNLGILSIQVATSLGDQPSWWSTDFLTKHALDLAVSAQTLTQEEVTWMNASGVYPRDLVVKEATLGALLKGGNPSFNDLTLTQDISNAHPFKVTNSLTLNDGVELSLTGNSGALMFLSGSRLVLGEGSTIRTDNPDGVSLIESAPQAQHAFVVSIPGEAINETDNLTPFLSAERKSLTAIETRNALTNVNAEKLNDYAGWIIKGNVTGVQSTTESGQVNFTDQRLPSWDHSQGIGALTRPVEVASGASLSAPWLTPYGLLDIYGTVSTDYLMIADPTVGDSHRPSSAVIVHAGGTLEVKKQAYFNAGYSTSLNILTDGLLRADKDALIQSGYVIANAQLNVNRGFQTRQSGTWEPSFDEDNTYDLTDALGQQLTKRFEKIVVTSPSSVTVNQEQTAAYSVAGTLTALNGTVFKNAVDVAGTLSLEGTVSFANANADTPWLTTLTLHPTSTLTLAQGATLTLGGSSIVTDAPVLASTDGAPSWWSTLQTALSASSREATLVTTAATTAVDASAFKRWEVRGVGDNIAQALPEETLIYAGKSLTLTMPQLDSGVIKNLGTVKFDAITLNNQGSSRIMGGGAVEKVGSGTAIMEGAAQYAGHTTVQKGTLQLRRGASLTGNLTVKPRAVLYASLESPTTMAAARRLARSVTSTADLTPTSSSNSLTFVDGSIFRVDALSESNYTRHSVVANVDIGKGVKLEVNIGSELESLAPDTVLSNVLTWGGTLTGTFAGALNNDGIKNLVYEVTDNDKLDLQAIYVPEAKAMHLKVVANHEHLAPEEPTPDNPDTPDTPSTDTPDTPPIVPVRAGEEPLLSGTTKVALAEFVHEAQRGLFDHERQCEDTTPTLWASLIGGRGKYANDGNVSGFSSEHTGVAAGTEVCRNKTRVGVMLAGAHSKADNTLNRVKHESKSDAWYVSLYGERVLNDTVALTGHLGAGKSHLKGSRLFRDEGLSADSRTRATLYSAGVGLEAKVTDMVKPFVRLDYTRVSMRGFTETGANEHNQHVARDTYDELVARVGATLSGPLNRQWSWQARASVGVDLLDGVGTTHARFVDGSGVIATKNDSMSRVLGDVALGLNYQVTSSWELNASLAGQVRKHYREGAVELRSVWTF